MSSSCKAGSAIKKSRLAISSYMSSQEFLNDLKREITDSPRDLGRRTTILLRCSMLSTQKRPKLGAELGITGFIRLGAGG
jgi:hypothetical protein